ncbi:hypothetical protein ANCCAN_01915 [Ancylostoma caninum]|uniref:Uncharacterized protein n=1 Tax=Ancylostoma caninum TaxID=29170 RepID=A0A368H938_ANCCA|nr:hypothetical protein ANCCAN_01915 [Ancylostoma caninum]
MYFLMHIADPSLLENGDVVYALDYKADNYMRSTESVTVLAKSFEKLLIMSMAKYNTIIRRALSYICCRKLL